MFPDVNGNCLALDRVLSDIEERGVDGMVCLGDAIHGCPSAPRLYHGCARTAYGVMGNADYW